jgi:hypothetical protein
MKKGLCDASVLELAFKKDAAVAMNLSAFFVH